MERKTSRIRAPFAGGFVRDVGSTAASPKFAKKTVNMRIKGGAMVPRKGYSTKINMGTASRIRGMSNHNDGIAFLYNGHIHLSDTNVALTTDLGAVNIGARTRTSGPSITSYGNYLMVFNGWEPRVRDGTTLADIAFPLIDAWMGANIAEIFTNSRWISNGEAFVRRSMPAISWSPENIYNFTDVNSVTKTLESNVTAIRSAIRSMYVICEDRIYEFRNNYSDGADIAMTPVFKEIYHGPGTRNRNTVVSANNTVFYLTKENKIKTINYVPGIPNSQVGDISNAEGNSVREYIDTELDPDRTLACASRYDVDRLIKFSMKKKGSTYNDVTLIYDLKNKTWLVDEWKNFGTVHAYANGKNYVGSGVTGKIYLDEYGKTDDSSAIACSRETNELVFGSPTSKKALRGYKLFGTINLDTTIRVRTRCDGTLVRTDAVDKSLVSNEIVGVKTENVRYPFRKAVTRGSLFAKGYGFSFVFTTSGTNLDFSLENMEVTLSAVGRGNELFEK